MDFRLVQCFGVKRRPKRQPEKCRKRYIWAATGATQYRFGTKGTNRCPHCGSEPDFRHPFNRYLNGEITLEEAEALARAEKAEPKA